MISAPRMSELYWEPTCGGRYVHICENAETLRFEQHGFEES
jgi:hypothetical protein